MPKRFQNGKLETRRDVARPYYFIRVSVPNIKDMSGKQKPKREARILGLCDQITKKQAMALRAEVLEFVNAGRMVVQSQIVFAEVAKRYLEIRVPQLGTATQAKYRTQIEHHILPTFGKMRMCEIERPLVEQWLASKEKAGLGWWTRIDLKGILSGIFTTAKDWKLWDGDNPTKGLRIGSKREVREKRLLTAEDMRRLMAAMPEGHMRMIVLVIFATGLRVSEVLGLRWRNVNLDAGTVTVEQRWYRGDLDEPKTTASARTRQLGPVVDEVARFFPVRVPDRFVFVGDDGHVPPDERDLLRFELRPILKKLGLYYRGFGWHAFRRQNITWRQQVGATAYEAQKSAGHTRPSTTYDYTLVDVNREKDQVYAMFDLVMGTEGKVQ